MSGIIAVTDDIIYSIMKKMKKRPVYTFREDLEKRLKDPEFKKAWEESEAELQQLPAVRFAEGQQRGFPPLVRQRVPVLELALWILLSFLGPAPEVFARAG